MNPKFNEDCADRAVVLQSILDCYVRLTGREAKLSIYEHALFDFSRAGFTHEDMATVLMFIMRENKRNSFQYSLKLGHLINDHMRFSDLLAEAKARDRNRKLPPTPREQVLGQLRPGVANEGTVTGNAMSVNEILKRVVQ